MRGRISGRRCVAKMALMFRASSQPTSAVASAAPSRDAVPRPISSSITSERRVHSDAITATSSISWANADLPSAGTSNAPVRRKNASYRGTVADATGARRPQFASSAATSVARISDDFPAIFGAVSSQIPSRSKPLAAASERAIQYGHRPRTESERSAESAGRSSGRPHLRTQHGAVAAWASRGDRAGITRTHHPLASAALTCASSVVDTRARCDAETRAGSSSRIESHSSPSCSATTA